MGKSHIGLVYSQQINEVLDQLTNLVSIPDHPLGYPHSACHLSLLQGFHMKHFWPCHYASQLIPSFEKGAVVPVRFSVQCWDS